jgi:hypothetical protein
MSPHEKYAWIFETLDITPFLIALAKPTTWVRLKR